MRKFHTQRLVCIVFCFLTLGMAGVLKAQPPLNWAIAMDGPVGRGMSSNCLATDNSGNVYIAGSFQDTVQFDALTGQYNFAAQQSAAFLAKYAVSGEVIWAMKLDGAYAEGAYDIALDSEGNIYLVGLLGSEGVDFDPGSPVVELDRPSSNTEEEGLFIAKYDSTGQFIWANVIGRDGCDFNNFLQLKLDKHNNLYIGGAIYTVDGLVTDFDPGPGTGGLRSPQSPGLNAWRSFFASYNSDGDYRWAHVINEVDSTINSNQNFLHAITVDDFGAVYIGGEFDETVDFNPGASIDTVAGSPNSGAVGYISKYDTSGNYQWTNVILPTNTYQSISSFNWSNIRTLASDREGNIYATGTFRGPVDFNPGPALDTLFYLERYLHQFVVKYDSSGAYVWANPIISSAGQPRTAMATINAILVDGNDLYLTGDFSGSVDFDMGSGVADFTSAGGLVYLTNDVFVAKYDTASNFDCAWTIGGTDFETASDININNMGELYLTGRFRSAGVDFDPGPGTSHLTNPFSDFVNYTSDGGNAFLLKLESCPADTISATICAGESFSFGNATYSEPGVYKYTVSTDSEICGCDSVQVLHLAISEVLTPVIRVEGFLLSLTQTYATYQWIKDGNILPGATSATLNVDENGFYQVIVTNEEGCADTSAIYEVTNVNISKTHPLSKQIQLYPNPTEDRVFIQQPIGTVLSMKLVDVTGKVLLDGSVPAAVELQTFANGLYLLQIFDRNGVLVKVEKIVKR